MTYYRVTKDVYNPRTQENIIKNELYTSSEVTKKPWIKEYCNVVKARKNQTYYCFGCRFNSDLQDNITL